MNGGGDSTMTWVWMVLFVAFVVALVVCLLAAPLWVAPPLIVGLLYSEIKMLRSVQ